MFRAGSPRGFGWRVGPAGLLLLAACALALIVAPATLRAQTAPEPNDTVSSATGPLIAGQAQTATFEAMNDRDFFFFHVTADESVRGTLTVENLGGSAQPLSEIDVRVVDGFGVYAGADLLYIRGGESRTSTFTLGPGKYFVEAVTREGYGDTYRLTPGGDEGAFGEYADIAARCAAATASVNTLRNGLAKAKAKLRRAVGRVRRSRYASRKARQAARSLRTAAKARVASKRRALQAATGERKPWCFIPQ